MEQNTWKVKLVILWIMLAINFCAYFFLLFIEVEGSFYWRQPSAAPPAATATTASIFIIIFIMTWLSFVLKPKISRWLNIILGIIFLLYKVWALIASYSDGTFAFFINEIWGAISVVLIIWYGWKIPNQTKEIT